MFDLFREPGNGPDEPLSVTTGGTRYWILDSPNEDNRLNEVNAAAGSTYVAIVDDDEGEIIGYIHALAAQRVCNFLNTAELSRMTRAEREKYWAEAKGK